MFLPWSNLSNLKYKVNEVNILLTKRKQKIIPAWLLKGHSLPLTELVVTLHMSSKTWLCKLWSICPKFWYGLWDHATCSVPNWMLFGPMTTGLWGKEVGEFSIIIYEKMGWWAFFCPPTWLPQYKCIEISKLWTARTLHLWVYRPETCRDLSKQSYVHCIKILSKQSLI